MDPFVQVKETGKDERTVKHESAGRVYQIWSERESGGLRRPHDASTASQSRSDFLTTTVMTQHNQEEKKFALPLQTAEYVPRSMLLQSHASRSSLAQSHPAESNVYPSAVPQPTYQYPKSTKSVQDRIRIAREEPPKKCVPLSIRDDSSLEDTLEQQCNMQDLNIGNSDNYRYDQDDMNNNKEEEKQQNEKENAYKFKTYNHLNNIINILIVHPAKFSNLVPPFMDKFRLNKNMRCLQMVVTTIIERSIAESNFQYNGARMCKYFDTILEDSKELNMFSKELFRDFLCFQCKWESKLLEFEWLNQPEEKRDQRKCNGLILFLAELVVQMDESYAFTLGELLVSFIIKVFQRPTSSSVKYIYEALKLIGHVLKKDKSRNEDMENIMRALRELINNGQLDTHVENMIDSVHEFERKDWGRSTSNCDSSKSSNALFDEVQRQSDQLRASNNSSEMDAVPLKIQYPVTQKVQLNQPVMYAPDGKILFAEESEFLDTHAKTDFDDQGTSKEEPDDNYDDEIATAYEEFLRDSNNMCK